MALVGPDLWVLLDRWRGAAAARPDLAEAYRLCAADLLRELAEDALELPGGLQTVGVLDGDAARVFLLAGPDGYGLQTFLLAAGGRMRVVRLEGRELLVPSSMTAPSLTWPEALARAVDLVADRGDRPVSPPGPRPEPREPVAGNGAPAAAAEDRARLRSTGWAASELGTSTTTVRRLVDVGILNGLVQPGAHRRRIRVFADSVDQYKATYGRIDDRRAARGRTGGGTPVAGVPAAEPPVLAHLRRCGAQRDHLRVERADLMAKAWLAGYRSVRQLAALAEVASTTVYSDLAAHGIDPRRDREMPMVTVAGLRSADRPDGDAELPAPGLIAAVQLRTAASGSC